MRVFIVGGTGVLGRALLPLLHQDGHTVRLLVRAPEKVRDLLRPDDEVVPGDLLTGEALLTALVECDAAIHIGTAIPANLAAPGAWDMNTRLRTEGTRRFLDAALAAGVSHYIQQSIVMAYPDGGDRWLDESTPLDSSPDRATICAPVIAMEGMVRAIPPDRLVWCIQRGGWFVGRGTGQDALTERLRTGKEVVSGDGRNFFSPVHVADMARAVATALVSATGGSTFNIVDEPLRWGDYVDRLATLADAAPPRRDASARPPPSFRCRNDAVRDALDWRLTHSIWPTSS